VAAERPHEGWPGLRRLQQQGRELFLGFSREPNDFALSNRLICGILSGRNNKVAE
jgi:hypothetical protein